MQCSVTGLRFSVTQRCDIACFYCHKEGQRTATNELTPSEIETVVKLAHSAGITKVKLTGGEPLIRTDIVEIVSRISNLIKDLSMTTNGHNLSRYAEMLKDAGLIRVNINFPTLNPNVYRQVTGRDYLPQVLEGLQSALDAGLTPVKLNMVILSGVNDTEIDEMISFSRERNMILQLIELESPKRLTEIYRRYHFDLSEIEKKLENIAVRFDAKEMHNRKVYYVPNPVEVVRPMHNTEFCRHCARIRVTSDGKLKPCLFRKNGLVDIIGPIRKGYPEDKLIDMIKTVIKNKQPYWR